MRLPLVALVTFSAWAGDAERAAAILKQQCEGCHGAQMAMAKLDLRTREAMLRGGTRGAALQPGNKSASLLYRVVAGAGPVAMPPGGKTLPQADIETLGRWIDAGAEWPAAASTNWATYAPADLWAFQPRRKVQGTVDSFIAAKLKERHLTPAPRADRRTLIRRLTWDLTGLPPTPEEVESFLADRRPDAYVHLADRLLASPRYGERMARKWLDLTRYADTSGYSNDFERPNAWRYRDYVIRSFSQDKPYNRFVLEQLAGDELFPGDPEALLATGFLRSGPWEHTSMSVEAITRQMFLDDVTGAVGAVFLGLTTGCAKCHDHKFDPIPTKDYYRLQAVFAATEFARPPLPFLETENTRDFAAGRARLLELIRRTEARMARFDDLIRQRLGDKATPQAIRTKQSLTPAEHEDLKLCEKHLQLYKVSLERYDAKVFAVSSGPLDGATDGGQNLRYPKRSAYIAPVMHILPGGNVQSPGEAVAPGALSAPARYGAFAEPLIPDSIEGRRASLARWIADPANPLTARVIANRIWQMHFGRGLAADPNNFGKTGAKPTHPELLDWLANSLIEDGWSLKALHRKIVLSETYQRAAGPSTEWLAAYPSRRLEAEEIRDGILAVTGQLRLDMGGPGSYAQINPDVARQPRHAMGSLMPVWYPDPEKRLRNRRTIYTFQQRSLVDPLIEVFNGPGMDLSCDRRESSIVPTQAFALFNSEWTMDMALEMAVRLEREAATPRARIARAFHLAFGRAPQTGELESSLALFHKMTAWHRATPPPPKRAPAPIVHQITSELTGEKFEFVQEPEPMKVEANVHPSEVKPETRALADIALALLNANEFLYVF